MPSAIGLIPASAFSAIVVYAQELVPACVARGWPGCSSGFAFGMGALGAAAVSARGPQQHRLRVPGCAHFLPLIGLLTAFLPNSSGRSDFRMWGRPLACRTFSGRPAACPTTKQFGNSRYFFFRGSSFGFTYSTTPARCRGPE